MKWQQNKSKLLDMKCKPKIIILALNNDDSFEEPRPDEFDKLWLTYWQRIKWKNLFENSYFMHKRGKDFSFLQVCVW